MQKTAVYKEGKDDKILIRLSPSRERFTLQWSNKYSEKQLAQRKFKSYDSSCQKYHKYCFASCKPNCFGKRGWKRYEIYLTNIV